MHALIIGLDGTDILDDLTELGLQSTACDGTSDAAFSATLRGSDVLIVREAQVTRRMIEDAPKLVLIVVVGPSAKVVDLEAASERAIYVSHISRHKANARAELALGLIIALDRGLGSETAPMRGLAGRRLGIVGYGHAGRVLAATTAALGLDVRVAESGLTSAFAVDEKIRPGGSLEELMSASDIVCLLSSSEQASASLINGMKDGASLINLAGSASVALDSVEARVKSGKLLYGGSIEPDDEAHAALAKLKGALLFESNDTAQSLAAAAADVVRTLHDLLVNREVPGCVNLRTKKSLAFVMTLRHSSDSHGLTDALSKLDEEKIRILDISSTSFSGGAASSTRLTLAENPGPGMVERIRRSESILEATLAPDDRG